MTEFALEGYRALIGAFGERGYAVRSFADADPARPDLVLRHDIDMSPAVAAEMAAVEGEMGVPATYFVMVRSALYNAFAPESLIALRRIADLGHAIGLHLDAALYADDAAALDAAAARECAMLESMLDRPVAMISFHRPAPSLLGLDRRLAGRRHTYEPRFFSTMGYCSDSRGRWGHGHPLDHEAVATGRALQLLTHPIWWVGEPAAPARRLAAFLDARLAALDAELAAQCDVHVARRGLVRGRGQQAVSDSPAFRTLSPDDIRSRRDRFLAIAADVPGEYWTEDHFLHDLPDKWALSFAAWRGDVPVGYAILSRRTPECVHLHHFMVAAGERGRGLGQAMLEEVLRRAAAAGAGRLTLKVAAENAGAGRFYGRHGFSEAGREGAYRLLQREVG